MKPAVARTRGPLKVTRGDVVWTPNNKFTIVDEKDAETIVNRDARKAARSTIIQAAKEAGTE